jgi:sigma-B regulation protein RsbU (phosphoserine phosphatase)
VRSLLRAGAALFLLGMAAYSTGLIYYNRHRGSTAILGATYSFADAERAVRLETVSPAGAADRAGLRAGDRVLAVNGRALGSIYPFWDAIDRGHPGETVRLAVQRPDGSRVDDVVIRLDAPPDPSPYLGGTLITARHVAALQGLSFYPIPFLVVAGVVLMQRYYDRHAWVLAVMFAGFAVGAELQTFEPVIHPALRKPLLAYWALWTTVPPGALYFFFATFPEQTALDRRAPWLKVIFLGLPLVTGAALAIATLVSPGRPFYLTLGPPTQASVDIVAGIYSLAGYALGLTSLALNSFAARPETRRRTRVMLWGTAGAVLPLLTLVVYVMARGITLIDLPFWLWVGALYALFLLPLSFAYAVVRHRVMEIPVLLRRSARYVVVHHAIVLVGIVIGVALTFAFAAVFARGMLVRMTEAERGVLSGVAGAVFGVLVAMATRKGIAKVTQRLDRAFFREAYDARQLLQNLARQTRGATDRRQLAELLERSLSEALHPDSILVLLRTRADRLEPFAASASVDVSGVDALDAEREPMTRAGPVLIRPGELPPVFAALSELRPELLAPMQRHDERLEGLIVLGPRLSDEPYGREDRELVASVAGQAGLALQNLRLANTIAERMEAERRAEHELEIAREVQAKLLPQHAPALASLDCAGICVQARQVGGDYYDFLYVGPGQLALVLADVSGKGMSAALLMASLQASLRSQYAQAPDDLPRVLRAVNRTFFESTVSSRYATLFFAIYDERAGRLRYANCGHLPPVVLAADGAVERLQPTASVIGLFEEWTCETREIDLRRGDTLVMFTDGVVEAFDAAGDEFGEGRVLDLLRRQAGLPAEMLVDSVARAVQHHSGSAQFDDFTLVVARGRESASRKDALAAVGHAEHVEQLTT